MFTADFLPFSDAGKACLRAFIFLPESWGINVFADYSELLINGILSNRLT